VPSLLSSEELHPMATTATAQRRRAVSRLLGEPATRGASALISVMPVKTIRVANSVHSAATASRW
jgi:hypothetical protein